MMDDRERYCQTDGEAKNQLGLERDQLGKVRLKIIYFKRSKYKLITKSSLLFGNSQHNIYNTSNSELV